MRKPREIVPILLIMGFSCGVFAEVGTEGQISAVAQSPAASDLRFKPSPTLLSKNVFELRKLLRSEGGVSTGGGDEYVIDFIQTALNEVYPWAKQNQDLINADKLVTAVDPEKIVSVERVFESCQFQKVRRTDSSIEIKAIVKGPYDLEREGCYNQADDRIYLSRARYPLNVRNSPAKMSFVAHELLRRLKIEGNEHLITGQWNFSLPYVSSEIGDVAMAALIKGHSMAMNLSRQAADACQTHRNLSSQRVLDDVDQITIEMKTAATLMHDSFKRSGFWNQKNQACSPGDEAFVNASLLGLGNGGLNDLKLLITGWKRAGYAHDYPACWVADALKETTWFADNALKAATRHRDGDLTPHCSLSESPLKNDK